MWQAKRALYGFKQSLGRWFYRFTNVLKQELQSQVDHFLFIKHLIDEKIIVFDCYVGDIVLTGNHK